MKIYRCKHAVEAMRWTDTDENREAFAAWFEKHDAVFETRGPLVVMPEGEGTVAEGEWIRYSDNEFIAMEDELFTDDYEELPVIPEEAEVVAAAQDEKLLGLEAELARLAATYATSTFLAMMRVIGETMGTAGSMLNQIRFYEGALKALRENGFS